MPSHDAAIVRCGLDFGRQAFNRWDLTREVLRRSGLTESYGFGDPEVKALAP